MNFSASEAHDFYRLHLNESDSNNISIFRKKFCNEFDKISTHPELGNTELVGTISRCYQTSCDSIVLSNGLDELILPLYLTLFRKNKTIITSKSTVLSHETGKC